MDIILLPTLVILQIILQLYIFVLIVGVVVNWLIIFQIVNVYHPVVRSVSGVCQRFTGPPLALIRRYIPMIGPVDFSPLVLFLLVYFVQVMVSRLLLRLT